ncbi:MerR family transcriptional regulator [Bailinhaonella thermotolerans]|uniref:MerR family transcriptional regulator n=1 Tax=Bailinhaonella thermotolerans TaxID=1070861 RepID=A0A3A4ALT2_9ACTN|nr:MerR family transcriptional regulator [Bailinhaonella thermotolerans]RJL22111.1 MerR family transcriptional regulator [Bailinhaonella thermotolerans]
MDYTIGALAKLTGLPVKTIRYYSDIGVLPEHDRTPAGYRLYTDEDRARLELIRTLRELGLDLATIQALGSSQISLTDVLDLHLRAVETQIGALRRTRAVLRATLERGDPTDEDLRRLHALGRVGAADMNRLVGEFMGDVAGDNASRARWLACLRDAMVPTLPEEPTAEQLDAWLELTELLTDEDFRASLRAMSSEFWENMDDSQQEAWTATNQAVTETAMAAAEGGIDPESDEALPIIDRIVELMAGNRGAEPDPALRASILKSYDEHDPRAEYYWELMARIHGSPWPAPQTIAHQWMHRALRHRVARDANAGETT